MHPTCTPRRVSEGCVAGAGSRGLPHPPEREALLPYSQRVSQSAASLRVNLNTYC